MYMEGERYAKSRNVPITVLTDANDVVGTALNVDGSPTMYLIRRDGLILYEGSDSHDGPFWQAFYEMERA